MRTSRRTSALVLAASALTATAVATAGPAVARQSYDPNVTRVANPANTCKSIEGSVANAAKLFGVDIPFELDYAECVTTLAKGDAFVPGEGNPYAQCQRLGLPYPFVFYAGNAPEERLLPDLKVKNTKQCGSALYAFHTIFSTIAPYFPQQP